MTRKVRIESVWRVVLRDLRLNPRSVLRRANLPQDLFTRTEAWVEVPEYFELWDALVAEADDPELGLKLGQGVSIEMFDPALFAAFSSPDLSVALRRMSLYKRLMGPFQIDVSFDGRLRVAYGCEGWPQLTFHLGVADLVFAVQLARQATRSPIQPLAVTFAGLPDRLGPYREFFGVTPREGETWSLEFSELDGRRPFLLANSRMWDAFEPELRRQLAELDRDTSIAERAHAALLELLPSGRTRLTDVAGELGIGTRTLQRRLSQEGKSFQDVLDSTRERLARHYLTKTDMSAAEISFLLGFEDPNSLFRAFQRWTGTTPQAIRAAR